VGACFRVNGPPRRGLELVVSAGDGARRPACCRLHLERVMTGRKLWGVYSDWVTYQSLLPSKAYLCFLQQSSSISREASMNVALDRSIFTTRCGPWRGA